MTHQNRPQQSDKIHSMYKLDVVVYHVFKDVSSPPQMLGQFIARAIADHVLPMSFLDCYKGKVDCEHAR